jgi:hypothetical protein
MKLDTVKIIFMNGGCKLDSIIARRDRVAAGFNIKAVNEVHVVIRFYFIEHGCRQVVDVIPSNLGNLQ